MDQLLGKLQKSIELTPNELQELACHFSPESQDQAKAYLALSLLCQNVRKEALQSTQGSSVSTTERIVRILEPVVHQNLTETNETSLIRGISLLTATFRVDAEAAIVIFTKEGSLEAIMDGVDVAPSASLSLSVARLLAEASGHKKCRTVIPPPTRQWLEFGSRQSKHEDLAAACGVARVKLWQGSTIDAADGTGESSENDSSVSADELATMMKRIVISQGKNSGILEAVEGLAYLSTDPETKERLSNDPEFLKSLLSLVPVRKQSTGPTATTTTTSPLLYGVATIAANLVGFRPRLTEEQRQIERLKKMSKASQASNTGRQDPVLNDDAHVKIRIQRLVSAGLLPRLSILAVITESQAVHKSVARAFLSVVEDKDLRGQVLQAGGSKALQYIIRHASPPHPVDKNSAMKQSFPLEAIQALAKLSITSSPLHVYGPDVGPIYDALRPLSLLVIDDSTNQLQQFEGMMALTNLASHSPDVASRIANLEGFLSRVELLVLEDHVLLRRASMELVCNLISGSEKVFKRYAGDGNNSQGTKSKLQLVLAMCDVEDLPTRLAASGALATLMSSDTACNMLYELQMEKGRFLPVIRQLLLPPADDGESSEAREDVGSIHRAVICVLNFLTQVENAKLEEAVDKYKGQFTELQAVLLDLVKRREAIPIPDQILQCLLQTLRVIVPLLK